MRTRFVPHVIVALVAPLFASAAHVTDLDGWQHLAHADSPSALVDEVRRATQPFREVGYAIGGEYKPFLGCVSGPQEGAMGMHFVNSGLVEDGALDVARPEALIYESKHGRVRLVGVEYIVIADAWNAAHAEPPVMEGQLFQFNGSPNRFGLPPFYELHVWAWRENPNGAFVDWNPRVSCEG